MKDPVKDRLKRYALFERFGDDHFYPTIGAAVGAYVDAMGSTGPTGRTGRRPRAQGPGDPRGQPRAIPSTEPDGLRSGRRIMRNELTSPTRLARIGTSSAT